MAAKRTGICGLENTFHNLRWSWTLANTPVQDKEQSCEWGKNMNEMANYNKRRKSFGTLEFQRNESKCVKAKVCYYGWWWEVDCELHALAFFPTIR